MIRKKYDGSGNFPPNVNSSGSKQKSAPDPKKVKKSEKPAKSKKLAGNTKAIKKKSKSSKRVTVNKKFNRASSGSGSNFNFLSIVRFIKRCPPIGLGIFSGIIIGVGIIFILMLFKDFKEVKKLTNFKPNITTNIYDKNGVLIAELFEQKREIVDYEKIPEDLVHAFVAMEDNEFYDHMGVSPKGIVRAFFINMLAGRVVQGGSTITQQLSKILLTSRKRTLWRKIKEAFIALMVDATYTKDEIMSLYLNQIYLGHSTYGVEAAANFYFKNEVIVKGEKVYKDKHVWELNLAECALIASLPSAPSRLSPIKYPKRAMMQHRKALAQMAELGYITIEEAQSAYTEFWKDYLIYINELPPTTTTFSSRINKAPWFTEYIRRRLVKKYGEEVVYEQGLSVYTTLDIKKQLEAQKVMFAKLQKQTDISGKLSFKNEDFIIENYQPVVDILGLVFDMNPFTKKGTFEGKKINDSFQENYLDQLEILNFFTGQNPIGEFCSEYKSRYLRDKDFQRVEGALISINQKTGYIEAMVGGSPFTSDNQLNRVMQAYRQPGSSIKPLLYTAAIESRKLTPATAILDSPMVFLDNEGGDWIPENYEGGYFGLVRIRTALIKSINVISIRIAEIIGIDTVHKYFKKLLKLNDADAKRRLRRDFSIALGSVEVSPFELARAYAIIANGGRDVVPFSIRYIEDNTGKVIDNYEEDIKKQIAARKKKGTLQIIQPATAQVMISMMRSVIERGTGIYANPGRPAGGKTGTTNNWKDAWFVGYTPELTTAIWIGYDRLGMSLGRGQAGGIVVAPAWGEYMRKALSGNKIKDFPEYAKLQQINVCAVSGMRPSEYCKTTTSEVFVPGTVPSVENEDGTQNVCNHCSDSDFAIDPLMKKPSEDIVDKQKREIYNKIDDIDAGVDVLDNVDVGSDLLQ